jgi:membrane-associated protein
LTALVGAVDLGSLLVASGSHPSGIEGWLLHFRGLPAYALVGALTFAEAALMVGFVVPGETAVVAGGVLAGLGRVDLELMMVVVVFSAIVGDSVGYELGRLAGPWLLARRPLKGRRSIDRTMAMLERYGGPAVFLGRFLAFARAVIPGLAGMSGVRYRTFLFYNALGGIVWGVGYTLLGYIVGVSFGRILESVGLWSAVVVAAVALVAVGTWWWLHRRERRRFGSGQSSAT